MDFLPSAVSSRSTFPHGKCSKTSQALGKTFGGKQKSPLHCFSFRAPKVFGVDKDQVPGAFLLSWPFPPLGPSPGCLAAMASQGVHSCLVVEAQDDAC